jgi:hypothetical protein
MINMIPLTGLTFMVWCHLKNLKYAINEDKPLHKFGVRELGIVEYTYLFEDRITGVINKHFFIIYLGLYLSLNILGLLDSSSLGFKSFGM